MSLSQGCAARCRARNPRATSLHRLFDTHIDEVRGQWEERFERLDAGMTARERSPPRWTYYVLAQRHLGSGCEGGPGRSRLAMEGLVFHRFPRPGWERLRGTVVIPARRAGRERDALQG